MENCNMLILDNAATKSIVNSREILSDFKDANYEILVSGIVNKRFRVKGRGKFKALINIEALFIPEFPINLIAEIDVLNNYTLEHKYGLMRSDDRITVSDNSNIIGIMNRGSNNLFTLDTKFKPTSIAYAAVMNDDQKARNLRVHELHKRTAYLDLERLETQVRHNAISGTSDLGVISQADIRRYREKAHKSMCTTCKLAKTPAAPARRADSLFIPDKPGVFHCDIMEITFPDGSLKFLIGRDRQTNFVISVLIKNARSETIREAFEKIINTYKRYGHKLTVIHADNERGIVAAEVQRYLHSEGVNTVPCPPGRHARLAEVTIKTVKYTFRALIMGLSYPCPIRLYPWAIKWAVESMNLTLRSGNDLVTPLQAFCQVRTDHTKHLVARFGDIATTRLITSEDTRPQTAMASHTFAIVVGREDNWIGTHILLDLTSKEIIRRKHFKVFNGNNSTIYKRISSIGTSYSNTAFGQVSDEFPDEDEDELDVDEIASVENFDIVSDRDEASEDEINSIDEIADDIDSDDDQSMQDHFDTTHNDDDVLNPNATNTRKSGRAWKASPRYLENIQSFSAMVNDDLSIVAAKKLFDPDLVDEAVSKEINNMYRLKVWEDVRNPPQSNIIPSYLFLKAKYNDKLEFEKLKARLVACGNNEQGVDKAQTSSPTANIVLLCLILALASKLDLKVYSCDVTAAYLNAELERPVYMRLNKEIVDCINRYQKIDVVASAKIVKLKRSLYGLRESGKNWYQLLSSTLITMGLNQSTIDPCLFYLWRNNKSLVTFVGIYVDDFLIASNDILILDNLLSGLESKFQAITSQKGDKISFLNMSIDQSKRGEISLSQQAYIEKFTSDIVLQESKEYLYPHRDRFSASNDDSEGDESLITQLKSSTMKIMHVTKTRPDVLFNIAILATRTAPKQTDINDVAKVGAYLKATKDMSMIFRKNGSLRIIVYCDASFCCHNDRKSHTGYAVFIDDNSASILTKSYKQKCIATSTMEAELIALYDAARHALFLRRLLIEIGIDMPPVLVHEDNKAVIEILTSENIIRGNSKFVDRKYLSIREYIKSKELTLKFTGSKEQLADPLTKAVEGEEYFNFRNRTLGRV